MHCNASVLKVLMWSSTLTIFVVAALIFHASNIEPFKKYTDRSHGSGLEDLLTTFRFGIYTALGAGTILLLAVLPAVLQSRSLKEFAPWIPLFITVYSLSTVTIHKLQLPPPHEGVALADFSGVSVNVFSDTSTRVVSSIGSGTRTPSESHRHDALYFRELGPSSRTSHRTGSGDSEISLPFMAGQPPPHWDSLTRSLFASEHAHTEAYLPQDPLPRIDGYPGFANDMASEHSSLGSCHRLLEAY